MGKVCKCWECVQCPGCESATRPPQWLIHHQGSFLLRSCCWLIKGDQRIQATFGALRAPCTRVPCGNQGTLSLAAFRVLRALERERTLHGTCPAWARLGPRKVSLVKKRETEKKQVAKTSCMANQTTSHQSLILPPCLLSELHLSGQKVPNSGCTSQTPVVWGQ